MSLPTIDIDKITTLTEAKNVIELLLQMYQKQQEQINRLEAEIARLKGQLKQPHFNNSEQKSYGVTSLLQKKGMWEKRKTRT